jgi:hypothetical protein
MELLIDELEGDLCTLSSGGARVLILGEPLKFLFLASYKFFFFFYLKNW